MSRQVVKSDSATINIPELQFEIPANTQKGSLNTIEGFIMQSADALLALQEDRRVCNSISEYYITAVQKQDPETAAKLDGFIAKLQACARFEMPFTLILDDPAGNSYIENPYPMFVPFLN